MGVSMDSPLAPPQPSSIREGLPDHHPAVDEATRPVDNSFRVGRAEGGSQTHRSSISSDGSRTEPSGGPDITAPPSTLGEGRELASSPPATPSDRSSLTRFDNDESDSASVRSAQPTDFNAMFGGQNVASHGLDIALPGSSLYEGLSMEKGIKNLCAIDMEYYERYTRGYCYPLNHYRDWKNAIAPGPFATSFDGPPPPKGWSTYVHPEGTRYFYFDHPSAPVHVITEAWLYEGELRETVERCIVAIFEFMEANDVCFPPKKRGVARSRKTSPVPGKSEGGIGASTVLVLEARLTGNFGYYFVDHEQQRLFWLDKYDFSWSTGEVHIKHTGRSIGLEMRSQYWRHNELFPHLYEFTLGDLVKIDSMVSFAFGDVLTSDTSAVSGYSLDQLRDVREILNSYKEKSLDERGQSVGERRTICRVARDIYHERFLNLYGERGVRLDSEQSIYCSTQRRKKWVKRSEMASGTDASYLWYQRILPAVFFPKAQVENDEELVQVDADPLPDLEARRMHRNSFLMNVATLFMFGGPHVHASRLREITMDQIVNSHLLEKYTEKMVAEWRDVALYGTVLLGTNVSFLAIQTVDTASKDPGPRTAAQRASYFSVLASLGTIVSSLVLLILVRHREVMGNDLIKVRCQSRWGLESLALMYGTPFSLVIWAILGFFISFAIVWFGSRDGVVIGIVAVCLFAFLIFLGWAVSASYCESEPYWLIATKAVEKIREVAEGIHKAWVAKRECPPGSSTTPNIAGENLIDLQLERLDHNGRTV